MSNKGKQGKKGTKSTIVNCESITLVTKESTTTMNKDGVNTINHYPIKDSILGPIPEGVSIDMEYISKVASSRGLSISDVISQWNSALSQNNDIIDNLKDTIRGYQEENEKLAKDYNEVKESYDRAVKECVELNDTRKELKEDIKLLGDYYKDLQEDRNKLYQKTINNEITEEYVKSIEKANSDLHKQLQENKKDYVAVREALDSARHENESWRSSYESAVAEVKARIDDTEDLKKAIKTIAKHL